MTDKLTAEDWENFWEYLQLASNDVEAYWLGDWLTDRLQGWKDTPAHSCGCKYTYNERIESRTGHHTLQSIHRCLKCKAIVKVISHRETIRDLILKGNVRISDVEVLRKELGLI